jgi:hypothetical protein
MRKLAGRLGAGSEAPFAAALEAVCRLEQARADARADLEVAVVALRRADAKQRLSLILRTIAGVERDHGNAVDARAAAEESLALASAMNSESDIAQSRALLAEIARLSDGKSSAGVGARELIGGVGWRP